MKVLAFALVVISTAVAEANPYCYRAGDLGLLAPIEGAVVEETDAGIKVTFGKATRYQSVMEIAHVENAIPEAFNARLELKDGLNLFYWKAFDGAAGSGGPEASLRGQVLGGGKVLARVTCTTQAEHTPDPEWCLPHVKTLVLIAKSCNLDGEEE